MTSRDSVIIKATWDTPEGKKLFTFLIYVDVNIIFGLPSEPQIPLVVFEVGLLEKLRIDALHWLMHTGKTRLVVLVDVKEDWKAFFLPAKIEETKARRMTLLKGYCNGNALTNNDLLEEQDSDEIPAQVPAGQGTIYAAIADNILLDDWVGPVSGTIKLWEKGDNRESHLWDSPIVSSFFLCLIITMLKFHVQ